MASENLSGENRRAGWGDAAQLNEHVAFAFDGWGLRVRSVSFGFRRAQLCFDEIETAYSRYVQRQIRHPVLRWMAATLDGRVQGSEAVFEAKFMLPWSFSEEAAVEKHAPQLQHNLWIVAGRTAILSVITGGGKWVGIEVPADPLYQHLIVTAERKFWRCVENGEPPTLFGVEPPKPRIAAVRIVDMSTSNAWAEFAGKFTRTHPAFLEHERAKCELKGLVPEDAQQAIGHGVRAKRSKSGAITFELLNAEDSDATV
jgi:hypothetical protein